MEKEKKETVHHVLSYSYFVFLLGLILGMFLDSIYSIRIIPKEIAGPTGVTLMILAPLLILWAQRTSRQVSSKKDKLTKEDFQRGPYAFIRNPTQLSVVLLLLGFGFLMNSFFIILLTVFSFLISQFVFIKRQDKMLVENYGEEYLNYKKSVHTWL